MILKRFRSNINHSNIDLMSLTPCFALIQILDDAEDDLQKNLSFFSFPQNVLPLDEMVARSIMAIRSFSIFIPFSFPNVFILITSLRNTRNKQKTPI